MLQQVTIRVEIGPYVLRGREVEFLEVRQEVGEHVRCDLAFLRDPKAVASGVAALRLGELADAAVRVVLVADGGDETLAFEGRVREAEVDHLPTGAGDVTVVALSDSYVLGEHVDREYFANQTVASLAARFGVRVAGAVAAGAARDYVQAGASAWTFLAQVAAEEGLQLRALWPRAPGGAAAEPAEVGRGFADQTHALTWGRELMRLSTRLSPVNAGVTGAFYDPAEKHDHRFRGVRASVGWLGGAGPVVAAATGVATRDADGGDPGHHEPGRVGGVRARTLPEFRDRLQLESARRGGAAVQAQGASVLPALRAGDRIDVVASPTFALDGADPALADRTGVFGLTSVTHRWTGSLYENVFTATPWADYHVAPVAAEYPATHADGRTGGGTSGGDTTYALAVVVDDADPKGRGRVQVRYAFMAGEEATHWARLTGLGGGNDRGLGALPQVGDEVIVAAVAGDVEHPVVVGALWNGVDRAGHAPGRQHWVTAAGNALVFLDGTGPAGGTAPTAELYTREGQAWMQLAQQGPTGIPTVTLHSEGDLSLEAPNGQLRVTAKRYVAHVADAHATMAEGTHTVKSGGAVTVESGARVAMKAASDVALRAGGALRSHAGGSQTLTGSQVAANPPGATAPGVTATVPALPRSAWGPRPVPTPGPGRSTEDPKTPTRKELAAKAARVSLAPPLAPAATAPAEADGSNPKPNPTSKVVANTTASQVCNGQGLADPTNAKEFATGVQQLQNEWSKLDAEARRAQFQDLLNKQLAKSGVPDVRVRATPLSGGRTGELDFSAWSVRMQQDFFDPQKTPALADAQASAVADTAYHEARHAEQWFLTARRRAALGDHPADISTAMDLPRAVADAAAQNPLPTLASATGGHASPAPANTARTAAGPSRESAQWANALGECATAMDTSVYGAGAAARTSTLNEIPVARQATAAALDNANKVAASRGAASREYAAAYHAWQTADRHDKAVYQQYRDLPEEADAWSTGSLVHLVLP